MNKVLITGATGFLGKYLIEMFYKNGYEIIATGRNKSIGIELEKDRVKFVYCDLTDRLSVLKICKHVDFVVHAAAMSTAWGFYQDFYNINVLGTKNIVDACLENNIKRLIYVSSPSIYASKKNQLNIKEEEAPIINNLNNYIKTKLLGEKEINIGNRKGLYCVIIRPRGLFGVGDTSIVPRILDVNKKMGIPLFNNGNQVIDITYVGNVAYSILLAVEKENIDGEIFNITNDEPLMFKEIVDLLFNHINLEKKYKIINPKIFYGISVVMEFVFKLLRFRKEPVLTRYKASTLLYSQTLCIHKAKEKLGYKPLITVEEGIKIYAAWWHENVK